MDNKLINLASLAVLTCSSVALSAPKSDRLEEALRLTIQQLRDEIQSGCKPEDAEDSERIATIMVREKRVPRLDEFPVKERAFKVLYDKVDASGLKPSDPGYNPYYDSSNYLKSILLQELFCPWSRVKHKKPSDVQNDIDGRVKANLQKLQKRR